jgi:hypothetical protein
MTTISVLFDGLDWFLKRLHIVHKLRSSVVRRLGLGVETWRRRSSKAATAGVSASTLHRTYILRSLLTNTRLSAMPLRGMTRISKPPSRIIRDRTSFVKVIFQDFCRFLPAASKSSCLVVAGRVPPCGWPRTSVPRPRDRIPRLRDLRPPLQMRLLRKTLWQSLGGMGCTELRWNAAEPRVAGPVRPSPLPFRRSSALIASRPGGWALDAKLGIRIGVLPHAPPGMTRARSPPDTTRVFCSAIHALIRPSCPISSRLIPCLLAGIPSGTYGHSPKT